MGQENAAALKESTALRPPSAFFWWLHFFLHKLHSLARYNVLAAVGTVSSLVSGTLHMELVFFWTSLPFRLPVFCSSHNYMQVHMSTICSKIFLLNAKIRFCSKLRKAFGSRMKLLITKANLIIQGGNLKKATPVTMSRNYFCCSLSVAKCRVRQSEFHTSVSQDKIALLVWAVDTWRTKAKGPTGIFEKMLFIHTGQERIHYP